MQFFADVRRVLVEKDGGYRLGLTTVVGLRREHQERQVGDLGAHMLEEMQAGIFVGLPTRMNLASERTQKT
jgi:hypothetical protein